MTMDKKIAFYNLPDSALDPFRKEESLEAQI